MNEVAEVERLYSRQWWENRSNNELQEMVRGGLAAGESGAGAHREIERRARQMRKAEEDEAQRQETHRTALRIRILAAAFLAMLISLLILEIVRVRGR
ncbi:MAG TPA: hypothetical protein VHS33_05025 [Sphingomicrobium sp.]|jgi:hypothetical protein|nr:hypothetical protein [Sphingomicrobium sp.]